MADTQNNSFQLGDVIEDWSPEDDMLEVKLSSNEDFLKIIETLTRIGVESKNEKKLTQTCHILKKRGKYYIMHFKELFLLDGKTANFTYGDLFRRNTIARILEEWEMLKIVEPEMIEGYQYKDLRQIKILSYKEKNDYELCSKYTVGIKKRRAYFDSLRQQQRPHQLELDI